MAPVNPYATLPPVPAAGQPANPAPVRNEPATGFTPGLDAPRATPRLSDLVTGQPRETEPATQARDAAAPAPPAGVQKGFSLQQLSAYAGLVMEADNPVQPGGGVQRTAPARNAPAERPLRPGSRLDLTV